MGQPFIILLIEGDGAPNFYPTIRVIVCSCENMLFNPFPSAGKPSSASISFFHFNRC